MTKLMTGLVAGLLLVAAAAFGQSYLPVPSGVVTADQILVGVDANNVQGSSRITPSALTVGSGGSAITGVSLYQVFVSPAQVAATTCAEQSFAVTGVISGEHLSLTGYPVPTTAGTAVAARPDGSDLVQIRFCNPAATPVVPDDGIYRFLGVKPG